MKIAFIKTHPKDMRNQHSINLGFEIIKNICIETGYDVDVFNFYETVNCKDYYLILFNVFYIMNQFNVIAFF